MFQPYTITFNSKLLLISRYDGADYHGPVPRVIRFNPLRYSFTIWPGTPRYFTVNRKGWLARKLSNAWFRLRRLTGGKE